MICKSRDPQPRVPNLREDNMTESLVIFMSFVCYFLNQFFQYLQLYFTIEKVILDGAK